MQLTITINPGNLSEVRQGIALLNGFLKDAGLTPVETPVIAETKLEKVTREKKSAQPAEQPKEPAPSSAGESSATTASAGTADDEKASHPTLEQLSHAVISVGKAGKRSDLVEYLDTLGVKKASEAPVEKWAAIIEKCNHILAEV